MNNVLKIEPINREAKILQFKFMGSTGKLKDVKKYKLQKPTMPVQPLKSDEEIGRAIDYFLSRKERYKGQNVRDCAIFVIGINVLKRAGDLLGLTWGYLLNSNHTIKEHLTVKEKKRGKITTVVLNEQTKEAIELYYKYLTEMGCVINLNDPVFPSRNKNKDGSLKPMTVNNFYKKMKTLERELELEYPIGTHTLRKTLPYAMLRENAGNAEIVEEISELLGHSDARTTRRYIGLTQEKKDSLLSSSGKGSMTEALKKHDYKG